MLGREAYVGLVDLDNTDPSSLPRWIEWFIKDGHTLDAQIFYCYGYESEAICRYSDRLKRWDWICIDEDGKCWLVADY